MHKFQKQGGQAANRRTRPTGATKWSRIEQKIGSAASEHACGVQATAGEGHRRSLCSPDAPLAGVGWGGQWAMKVQNLRKLLSPAERPATGLNLLQISLNAEATQISKRICRNSGRGQSTPRRSHCAGSAVSCRAAANFAGNARGWSSD